MNAKVLFLVICLASAILYVTHHLVIYEVSLELNSVPHGPSNEQLLIAFLFKRTNSGRPAPFKNSIFTGPL